MATVETYPCGCDSSTENDVANLLHVEETACKEEGWKLHSKNDDCEIWGNDDVLNPVHFLKGFLHFKDIPPQAIVDIIYDLESRKKWDEHFSDIEVLENYEYCRIVYWLCKMPVGVSDIDFIQRIVPHYDEKTNTTFIKSYHATHPSKPEVKGVISNGGLCRVLPMLTTASWMTLYHLKISFKDLVKVAQENSTNKIADILVEDQLQSPLDLVTVNLARPPQTKQLNQVAGIILSGVIIRPQPDDPKSTRVTLLFEINVKGLTPHITNAFLSTAPLVEWQNALTKYYWKDYSKKKDAMGGQVRKD